MPRHALPVAMHAAQLSVGVETVRELIANQFPEWSGLPITEFASQGTVNALFLERRSASGPVSSATRRSR